MKTHTRAFMLISTLSIISLFYASSIFAALPETEISSDGLKAPTTTALPKTSGYLTYIVDNLVTDINTKSIPDTDTESFCSAIDSTFLGASEADRSSFAWNVDSYSVLATPADEVSKVQKDLYAKERALQMAMSSELDLIGNSDVAQSRLRTIFRSVLVEVIHELGKSAGPDMSRVENLIAFNARVLTCLRGLPGVSADSHFQNIQASFTSFKTNWDENKSYVAQGDQAPEAADLSLTINRSELEPTTLETIRIDRATSVATLEDLKLYAETLMRDNDRIKKIVMNKDMTEISYAANAKFLGFAKTYVIQQIIVDNTNNGVQVRSPWYKFLMKKSASYKTSDSLRDSVAELKEGTINVGSFDSISAFVAHEAMVLESVAAQLLDNAAETPVTSATEEL